MGAEINQLHDDLLKFIEQTEPEFQVSNRGSQLFGVVEGMNQITADEQAVDGSMPLLTVSTDDFLNDGAGVIYIYEPNKFDWYWDR